MIAVSLAVTMAINSGCSLNNGENYKHESEDYETKLIDYSIEEGEVVPFSLKMLAGYLFCFVKQQDMDKDGYEIVQIPVMGKDESLAKEASIEYRWFIEGAKSYDVVMTEDNKVEIFVLCILDDEVYVMRLGKDGSEKVKLQSPNNNAEYPFAISVTSNNRICTISGSSFCIYDESGANLYDSRADGFRYTDVASINVGKIALFLEKEDVEKAIQIFDVEKKNSETVIKNMSDVQQICAYNAGYIYVRNGEINFFKDSSSKERVYDLVANKIDIGTINFINIYSGKLFLLFLYDENTKIRITAIDERLIENHEASIYNTKEDGIVKIYCNGNSDEFIKDLVNCFNAENDVYTAVLVENNELVDSVFINEDNPDVFFEMSPTKFYTYKDRGYFEDISICISESKILNKESLLSFSNNYCKTDDTYYGVYRYINPITILLPTSYGVYNWTIDEFIDWTEKAEAVYSVSGMNKEKLIEYVLYGCMSDFIDFDSGEACFNSDDFKNVLKRLPSLDIQETQRLTFNNDEIQKESFDASKYLIDGDCASAESVASYEKVLGEELCVVGFPNKNRENISYALPLYNMAVFSNSNNKKGAYAFIEYCLINGDIFYNEGKVCENEYAQGMYWNYNNLRESGYKEAIGKREYNVLTDNSIDVIEYEVTEENIKLLEDMVKSIEYRDDEWMECFLILYEEVQDYLKNSKDVEVVSDVVQHRLQTLLSEHR